jgi:hypothetical protein
MAFVEATHDYPTTRKRTSDSYVKFSPDFRLVLRILDDHARPVWKHWIPEANRDANGHGRGMMANCPNTDPKTKVCPIEKSLEGRAKDDEYVIQRRAKKRYIVNVLDRTPYGTCPSCNEQTPKGKSCFSCKAPLKTSVEYSPLNKVKLLEGGPTLFAKTLSNVESMQKEDFPDKEITDYDITFTTNGTGRDRQIAAIPQNPTDIDESAFIDPETGEPQKRFNLDMLAEPTSIEEIEAMLGGATIEELNAIRGIA